MHQGHRTTARKRRSFEGFSIARAAKTRLVNISPDAWPSTGPGVVASGTRLRLKVTATDRAQRLSRVRGPQGHFP